MTTPTRGFDDAEFAARCTHAQVAMARADVGALLLTTEAEIRYFTGFYDAILAKPNSAVVCRYPAIRQTCCYHSIDRYISDAAMLHRKHH